MTLHGNRTKIKPEDLTHRSDSNQSSDYIAAYGCTRTEALPLLVGACTLKRGMAQAAYVTLHIECTTIRAKVANKRYIQSTQMLFLQHCHFVFLLLQDLQDKVSKSKACVLWRIAISIQMKIRKEISQLKYCHTNYFVHCQFVILNVLDSPST